MTPLTKYEQETIINFNAGSSDAIVYTRDKTYIMPKKYVTYCKPRNISEERRNAIREQISAVNNMRNE